MEPLLSTTAKLYHHFGTAAKNLHQIFPPLPKLAAVKLELGKLPSLES